MQAIGPSGRRQHDTGDQHPGPPLGTIPGGQVGGKRLQSKVQIGGRCDACKPEAKETNRRIIAAAECSIIFLNLDVQISLPKDQ